MTEYVQAYIDFAQRAAAERAQTTRNRSSSASTPPHPREARYICNLIELCAMGRLRRQPQPRQRDRQSQDALTASFVPTPAREEREDRRSKIGI